MIKQNETNFTLLVAIFVTSLSVATVVAAKVVDLFGLIVPAAVVAYGITFLITDLVGEIWGKEKAKLLVKVGLGSQVLLLGLITLAIWLPPAYFGMEFSEKFSEVLGQSWRIVLASLSAYFVSQFTDVFIFHKLKQKFNGKHRWIRNNASTAASQFIDTSIFITIAFIGVVPEIWVMIVSQYVVKLVIALIDTPIFYLLTKKR